MNNEITVCGVKFKNSAIKGDAWEDCSPCIFEALGFNVKRIKRADKARAAAGRTDFKVYKKSGGYFSVDAKSGASVLSYDNTRRRIIEGSSIVCYAPIIPDEACIVSEDKQSVTLDFNKIEYFILKKSDFIEALKIAGLYKEDFTSSAGDKQIHIKTFYSNTQNKLMSAKKYRVLIEELYNRDITTEIENW